VVATALSMASLVVYVAPESTRWRWRVVVLALGVLLAL
jgi:hypothetical protein